MSRSDRDDQKRFWSGADVVWDADDEVVDGSTLARGDRMTVVDAGAFHVRGFTTMTRGVVRIHGKGVAVECPDGRVVEVPPASLELVAPDHPLEPEPDGSQASWWLGELTSGDDWPHPTSHFVPSSFEAVAVVLHPWQGERTRWADMADANGFGSQAELATALVDAIHGKGPDRDLRSDSPIEGQFDLPTARALVPHLVAHTSTPGDAFVAVWEGWGDTPVDRFPGAAHVDVPQRGHFLLRGPAEGVLRSVAASGFDDQAASGIWWPADRAWFVASEIDFHWSFVAGTRALVDALVADPDLEVLHTTFDHPGNQLPPPGPTSELA